MLASRRVEQLYRALLHVAIIIAQQPAQAIALSNLGTVIPKVQLRCNELVGATLMIPLSAIVAHVLLDRIRCGVIPAICTRRVASSITTST
jgi:hypothetical protein